VLCHFFTLVIVNDDILMILEGKIYRKNARGRPRRMWMDDRYEWSANKTYGEVKRQAADRNVEEDDHA